MNIVKVLMLVGLAGFVYQYWSQHREAPSTMVMAGSAGSANGFVPLPGTSAHASGAVQVIAAQDCPEEAAQRADRLTEQLASRGIPVARSHQASFTVTSGDPADAQRITAIMNGELPIVLVRGKAKSNPSVDDVVAEYRSR